MRDYADMIRSINKQDQSNIPTLKIAEVTSILSGPGGSGAGLYQCDIKFDDVSPELEAVYGLSSYVPKVGDIVRVAMVPGGGPLILGTVWGTHGQPSNITQTYAVFGGTSSFTSTTYVDLLGTTTPIYQHFESGMSAILVRVRGTSYCSQATTSFRFGIQFDGGADIDLENFAFSQALVRCTVSAERLITSLDAGAHDAQLRIRITGGTAATKQVNFDTQDSLVITLEECLNV